MAQAQTGDKVKVHYTGTFDDGTVFDSSDGRDPLEFTVGEGQVIAGFDEAITGMQAGEEQTVRIPVDKAYGPRRDDLNFAVPRSQVPEGMDPKVGDRLQVQRQDGEAAVVTVIAINEDEITLDANHPMAGKDLNFKLNLVEIG
jgi:peptidylprolyl isomerase